MLYEYTDIFRDELALDERLLWSGRPRQGIVFRALDIIMIPFSLFWGGFMIFWETMAISYRAPFFFSLFGIPFVLIGIYIIVGRFFGDAKLRQRTFYALTAGFSFWPGAEKFTPPSFDRIEDARQVYDMIRKAQREL